MEKQRNKEEGELIYNLNEKLEDRFKHLGNLIIMTNGYSNDYQFNLLLSGVGYDCRVPPDRDKFAESVFDLIKGLYVARKNTFWDRSGQTGDLSIALCSTDKKTFDEAIESRDCDLICGIDFKHGGQAKFVEPEGIEEAFMKRILKTPEVQAQE